MSAREASKEISVRARMLRSMISREFCVGWRGGFSIVANACIVDDEIGSELMDHFEQLLARFLIG